ncbi:alpha-amylase family glycosyl hydrolase [Corallincola spongiicola]|uniref:PKD domain-containing protein n=1 Tax=Corallincola spongiicola TaxID=2520508 RepID=A0ABY1WLW7_9GAMM|nr:alpha-amylase family glycosyl hydrolase [Corallincola spongiicola]TAA41816.1 hypothetical protein EXY25_16410 [Corallincola spongiicola]
MRYRTIAVAAGLSLLTLPAQADWFFRGTANNWGTTQLEQVTDNKYQLCTTFGSGDATGGPRFKIDRYGNWNENYPDSDVTVDPNQSYLITFLVDSTSITADPVGNCDGDDDDGQFAHNFASLHFRGTPNNWAATPMTLTANNTWQTTVSFDGQTEQRFKLDVTGNWSQNYGGSNGQLTFGGGDIFTDVIGNYVVEVNDETLRYTITLVDDGSNQKPIAVINPNTAQTVTLGDSLTFDADNSSDSDGSIVTYDWSTGDSSTSITVVFDTLGQQTISLTVTDDQGADSTASVTISVEEDGQGDDRWYFRGTPNGWATTLMTTTDSVNYCTTQTFGSDDPRFKIDHHGDWIENYPAQDYTVVGNTTYDICFNANSKDIDVTEFDDGVDRKAPVVTASPNPGTYLEAQTIILSVTDDQDPAAKIYCTTDGSTPTTASTPCNDKTYQATDIQDTGADLVLKVLAVDATGNDAISTFSYTIGDNGNDGDFRSENVYFIMTDRFADGDTSNNNIWGDEYLPNGAADKYKISDTSKTGPLSYYHGGDFKGIMDNLDYIQGMGFTAIWITPVVKQPEGRRFNADGQYEASAFHGYWGADFDQIDPHLHSSGKDNDGWSDFDALVEALHARGMKLMLDIVVNHGQPGDSVVGSKSKWADKALEIKMDGQIWKFGDQDPYYEGTTSSNGFFSYSNGTWLLDLLDFNENGEDGKNAKAHLINVYKRFIDHGVDAFRIDTVSYMSADFWEEFTLAMDEHARSKGNDNFYMCGEAWTGDRTAAVDLIYNGEGKKFHMLDLHGSSMDFPGWMGKAFKGETGFDDGNGYARIAGADGDASGIYDPTYLATFVDNHDVTRANGILSQTQYMNNLNFVYLFRGLPVVFYGTEVLYSSWPHYITTTEKDDVVARWMLGSEGISYAKNNRPALYKHLQMLNSLRSSSTALQKGTQIDLLIEGDHAAFKRDLGGVAAYVALTKGAAFSYTFNNLTDGSYRLLTPDSANGTYNETNVTVSGGSFSVDVAANSFAVLEIQ